MSAEIIEATKEEVTVDVQKRAFMNKFGKYAVAGAGMAMLMTPTISSANCYGNGNCWQWRNGSSNYNLPKLKKQDRQAIKTFLRDHNIDIEDKAAIKKMVRSVDKREAWESLTPSQQAKALTWLESYPGIKNFLFPST